jgi:hypothetical protein
MKNILSFALLLCSLTAFAAPIPHPFFGKKVTLNSGTPILLECNEKIETSQASVGKTIIFKVKMNVMAENEVAISTGAVAIGRVKYLSESTYNNVAEARVELIYVQAVDGQQIPLNGNEFTVFGSDRGRGNGSTIEFGSNITANVTNNIDVKVK